MKPFLPALVSGVLLCACASTEMDPIHEGDGVETQAADLRGAFERAEAAPAPNDRAPRRAPGAAEVSPLQVLAQANTAARQRPMPEAFNRARYVFNYEAGALYQLYTNPRYVSTILLEPGETLHEIAAGDTSRWMVTEARAESANEPRTIVLVKPQAIGLRTNIVLISDRRTYLIEALSQAGPAYAAQVVWSYPQDRSSSEGQIPSIDRLNFGYRVRTIRGRTPNWAPSLVFDDGRRTWIEFPSEVAASDMAPLFIITAEGVEIANYRVQGRRYIVDRLFERAELRLGARAPVIVRIDRRGARP